MNYWITTEAGEAIRYEYDADLGTTNRWVNSSSTKELVQGEITAKQKKMIKEEIKVWMDDHLQKTVQKEAGKILKDIEKLKEEKTRLGKSISALKQEMRKTKKEVRTEIEAME